MKRQFVTTEVFRSLISMSQKYLARGIAQSGLDMDSKVAFAFLNAGVMDQQKMNEICHKVAEYSHRDFATVLSLDCAMKSWEMAVNEFLADHVENKEMMEGEFSFSYDKKADLVTLEWENQSEENLFKWDDDVVEMAEEANKKAVEGMNTLMRAVLSDILGR